MTIIIGFILAVAVPTAIATWFVAKRLASKTTQFSGVVLSDPTITVVFGRKVAQETSVAHVQEFLQQVAMATNGATKRPVAVRLDLNQQLLVQIHGEINAEERDFLNAFTRSLIGRE
jgi:hypothetical protein